MAKRRRRRLRISKNVGAGRLSRARVAGFAANPGEERDPADRGGQTLPADEEGQAGREGGSPHLTLTGFSGPLDHLLTLARAQKIDLSAISLAALVDQLVAALRQAPGTIPLGQKGDWVVMAAWVVQLRTRLLLPQDVPTGRDAAAEVDQLRTRLVALDDIQALAFWLERRPQLGHDVFARRRTEFFGNSVEAGQAIDVVEFLWASLALFDDETEADTAAVYRPRPFELYQVAEARERILRLLVAAPDGAPLERLLPDPAEVSHSQTWEKLRRRSAWSSTFVAGLELAKQGEVVLGQGRDFEPIHVAPA
jgi:segregation and condensation protein A